MPMSAGRKKGSRATYKYSRTLDFWKDKEKDDPDEPIDGTKSPFSFWKEREALGDKEAEKSQQEKEHFYISATLKRRAQEGSFENKKTQEESGENVDTVSTDAGNDSLEFPTSGNEVMTVCNSGDYALQNNETPEDVYMPEKCLNELEMSSGLPYADNGSLNSLNSLSETGSGESNSQHSQTSTKKVCFDPCVVTIGTSNEIIIEEGLASESDDSDVLSSGLKECRDVSGDENVDPVSTSFGGSDLWEMEALTDGQLAFMLHVRDGIKIKEEEMGSEEHVTLDINVELCNLFSNEPEPDCVNRESRMCTNDMKSTVTGMENVKANVEFSELEKQLSLIHKKYALDEMDEENDDMLIVESEKEQSDSSKRESPNFLSMPLKFQRYIEKNFSESTEGSDSGETQDIEGRSMEERLEYSSSTDEQLICRKRESEKHQESCQNSKLDTFMEGSGNNPTHPSSSIPSHSSITEARGSHHQLQTAMDECEGFSQLSSLDDPAPLPVRDCYSDLYNFDQTDMFYVIPKSHSATEVSSPKNERLEIRDFVFYDKISDNTLDSSIDFCTSMKGYFVQPRISLAAFNLNSAKLSQHISGEEISTAGAHSSSYGNIYPDCHATSLTEGAKQPEDSLLWKENQTKINKNTTPNERMYSERDAMAILEESSSASVDVKVTSNENSWCSYERDMLPVTQNDFQDIINLRKESDFQQINTNEDHSFASNVLNRWSNGYPESMMCHEWGEVECTDRKMQDGTECDNYCDELSKTSFTLKKISTCDKGEEFFENGSKCSQTRSLPHPSSQTKAHPADTQKETDRFLDEPGYDWKEDFYKWKNSRKNCPEGDFEKVPKKSVEFHNSEKSCGMVAEQVPENNTGKSPAISLSCSVPLSTDQQAFRKSPPNTASKRPNCRFYLLQRTRSESSDSEYGINSIMDNGVFIVESKQGDFVVPSAPGRFTHVDATSNTSEISAIQLLLHDKQFRKVKMIWAIITVIFIICCFMILWIDKLFPDHFYETGSRLYTLEQILNDHADL